LLLPALFGIRALMGVFTAPVYPASSRMVSHWIPWSQRSWANGLVQGSAAVGMAAAFPVFGSLIDWFDWPTAFLITGGCTAALALLWTVYATNYPSQHRLVNEAERKEIGTDLVMGRSDGDDETEPAPSWSLLLRHRSLVLLTVAYAAVGYIEYLFFFWMHYYFETVLKLEKDESRIYTTYMFLTMAIGMAFGGWLSDRLQVAFGPRWGRAAVPMAGMIVGAALLGLGLTAHDTTWIVIWLCLSLGAVGACEAPVWTTAVELGGRHGGTAAGICNTGGNLGGLLAPMVTPWISQLVLRYGGSRGVDETTSWQIAISVGAVICLSGAVLWLWIDPRERVVLATPSDTESYDTES
jgi:ACS family D-galactonate transporter-like MFS transporter